MNRVQYQIIIPLAFAVASLNAFAEEKKPEKVSVFGEAALEVPVDFPRAELGSSILDHEFKAKAGEKSARLTMMGASGGIGPNIERWKTQFVLGDAKPKTEVMELGKWKAHLVQLAGKYKERSGGPFAGGRVVERPDYAMLAAILEHPEGRTYFIKMIGPEEVITKNRKAFVKMVKSIDQ